MSFRARRCRRPCLMLLLVINNLFRREKLRDIITAIATVAIVSGPALSGITDTGIPRQLQSGDLPRSIRCAFSSAGCSDCLLLRSGTLAYLTFTTWVPTIVMIGRMDEACPASFFCQCRCSCCWAVFSMPQALGRAIVELLSSMFGHIRAGMSYVLLGSLFLVSGISGSKVSDMATVAPALFPEMKRLGHKPKEMIALLATGAAMADTVPPLIVLIVLGSAAGVSIAGLSHPVS